MASDPQTFFENNGVDRKRPKGEIRLQGLSDQNKHQEGARKQTITRFSVHFVQCCLPLLADWKSKAQEYLSDENNYSGQTCQIQLERSQPG